MLLTAACLLCAGAGAPFDYMPVRLQWLKWAVGYENHNEIEYPVHEYFIGNMIDGDPKTAFMVGGTQEYVEHNGVDNIVANPKGDFLPIVYIELPKPMNVDGLRIMPGYNKSEEIFKRNNRITRLAIYDGSWESWSPDDGTPITVAKFDDSMGWKTVRFKSRSVDKIQLQIKDWAKGTDNDFCISEIQLLSGGKPVDWQRTPTMLYTSGSD
ncbi:MAG TPA: hypothetical protein VNI20_01635 [Fimbriimonadaceae bacterium]|nr:hypothetical protein [Fimbriimonadaceae bacterium]